MEPKFKDGRLLIFHGPTKRIESLPGKIVLVVRDNYPGVFFIKRVKKVSSEGIWVEGDNLAASTDSRTWGYLQPHEIVAVAFRK